MLRNRQAPSRASPQTLCQKCLKKDESPSSISVLRQETDSQARHYSYECKATIQDRPYQARPSRSQQLANPKLMPKLSSDKPNELLRKEGLADELLAKAEIERGRERNKDRERSRSLSVSSVSTISTRDSRSPARQRTEPEAEDSKKRRRRSSSSGSSLATSDSSPANRRLNKERNMRRRHSSTSPAKRGRNLQQDSSSRRRESSTRHG